MSTLKQSPHSDTFYTHIHMHTPCLDSRHDATLLLCRWTKKAPMVLVSGLREHRNDKIHFPTSKIIKAADPQLCLKLITWCYLGLDITKQTVIKAKGAGGDIQQMCSAKGAIFLSTRAKEMARCLHWRGLLILTGRTNQRDAWPPRCDQHPFLTTLLCISLLRLMM